MSMNEGRILDGINHLSPTGFENLTYDLLRAIGLKNMVWRTPGADGGRDIEGLAYSRDISGHEIIQRWSVECKLYSTSIDWPTIWRKLAYADVQKADVLLISTNTNPSPHCETEVSKWNGDARRPILRFWRGYDFPRMLNAFPDVACSYGFTADERANQAAALPLAFLITKISQAAYVAGELGIENGHTLETAASLSELLSQRLDDLARYGYLVPAPRALTPINFAWADIKGDIGEWEEVGLRAILSLASYQLNAKLLSIHADGRRIFVQGVFPKLGFTETAQHDLAMVALWARAEVTWADPGLAFYLDQRV